MGIHFYVVAVLLNVRVAGHTPGEESDRSDAENSQQHDHTDHNEDNFQRSASLTRIRWRNGSRRTLLGVAGVEKFDAGEEASTAAPHLLQNRIPE